jgi:hypothetical protein
VSDIGIGIMRTDHRRGNGGKNPYHYSLVAITADMDN